MLEDTDEEYFDYTQHYDYDQFAAEDGDDAFRAYDAEYVDAFAEQIELANYHSSRTAFDYNARDGFHDDAGNFYDRDAMRELPNFHFENGLNLNHDDDWDEVTVTTPPGVLDSGLDANFLASIRKMVANMKEGTLSFT